MNYTRLIIIIALVLVIAYMNRSVREGMDLRVPCPDGQVLIPGADVCDVPGSTAAPSAEPTCPPGSTRSATGCENNTTRAFVFPDCPSGYGLIGTKCWGACPGNKYGNNMKTCRTDASSAPNSGSVTPASTPAAAPAATPTRTLADVTKDIDYLKSIGLNEGSDNDGMKRLVAERASLGGAPPVTTPPYSNSPSALANVPSPSMSCAVENFSSF